MSASSTGESTVSCTRYSTTPVTRILPTAQAQRKGQRWHHPLPYSVPLPHARVAVVIWRRFSYQLASARGHKGREDTPKLRSGLHPHRPCSHSPVPLGQCVYGLCSYPMLSKKWIWSFRANSAAAMLCTGASPQRYRRWS